MLCHSVRSCHWPSLSLKRSLVASENFATGLPCGVYLISGSLPRFPTRMTLFTLFMTPGSSKTLTITESTSPAAVSLEHQICDESGATIARRSSRGAAPEYSPRREPWVVENRASPSEAKESARRQCRDGRSLLIFFGTLLHEHPIQHHINDHARHRNVEPQRKRPARNRPMPVKPLSQRPAQRNQDHRHNDDRENRVRGQDCKVHPTPPSRPPEMHRAHVRMVVEVGNQEEGRGSKSRQHHRPVRSNPTACNQRSASDQQHRATAIKSCVDDWKDRIVCHAVTCLYGETSVLGKWLQLNRGALRATSRELRATCSLEARSSKLAVVLPGNSRLHPRLPYRM